MMTSEAAGTPSSCIAHQAASDWVLDAPLIVWLALNSQEREAAIIPPSAPPSLIYWEREGLYEGSQEQASHIHLDS